MSFTDYYFELGYTSTLEKEAKEKELIRDTEQYQDMRLEDTLRENRNNLGLVAGGGAGYFGAKALGKNSATEAKKPLAIADGKTGKAYGKIGQNAKKIMASVGKAAGKHKGKIGVAAALASALGLNKLQTSSQEKKDKELGRYVKQAQEKIAGELTENISGIASPILTAAAYKNPKALVFPAAMSALGYLNNDKSKVDDSAWASNLLLPGVANYRLGKRLKGVKGTEDKN